MYIYSSLESNTTTASESDTDEDAEKKKKKKEKAEPTSRTVKVNLTAEITTLDLPPPSAVDVDLSTAL